MKLSTSNEDYLEAIFELSEVSGGSVRSVDIAEKMDVSRASVNKAINNLENIGLVVKPFYGDVSLTEEGKEYGREILHRHHVLYSFLTKELGVTEETAEVEACSMEHTMSSDTLNRLVEFLKEKETN